MNYEGYLSDLEELEATKLRLLEHRFRTREGWGLESITWDQLYPEHPAPYGEKVDRTYWRRGTTESADSPWFIPPNEYYVDKVIVFINFRYKDEKGFKQFYGWEPSAFADIIVDSKIIPVIAKPRTYKDIKWGEVFFEKLFDKEVIPIYSRRLEDLLAAKNENTDIELGKFDGLVKKFKDAFKVPENGSVLIRNS